MKGRKWLAISRVRGEGGEQAHKGDACAQGHETEDDECRRMMPRIISSLH